MGRPTVSQNDLTEDDILRLLRKELRQEARRREGKMENDTTGVRGDNTIGTADLSPPQCRRKCQNGYGYQRRIYGFKNRSRN